MDVPKCFIQNRVIPCTQTPSFELGVQIGSASTLSYAMGSLTHISLPHSLYQMITKDKMSLTPEMGVDLDGTLVDWELGCSTIDKNK